MVVCVCVCVCVHFDPFIIGGHLGCRFHILTIVNSAVLPWTLGCVSPLQLVFYFLQIENQEQGCWAIW